MLEFLGTYSYFTSLLYLTVVCLVFFFISKIHNKKEMLAMSALGISSGIFGGLYYTTDWWSPLLLYAIQTPFGTFGLEDASFGFLVFGIASVAGEVLFYRESKPKNSVGKTFLIATSIAVSAFVLLVVAHSVFGLHTFYASLISAAIAVTAVFVSERSLIVYGLLGGIALTIIAIPVYLIPLSLNGAWVQNEWQLWNLSGVQVFAVPIEEFIWFFVVGLLASIFWEYARGITFFQNLPEKESV